ncbi:MAG: MFS transporter [Steroidobacteraceae bacterium]
MSPPFAGVRAALRHRDYRRYAAGRFLATLAWQMLGVAVGWQVYGITRDPLDLGLVGLAQFAPFLALVLPAGHLADRADRRLVIVAAYVIEAACALVLIAFTLSGAHFIWPVFAAMALFGAGRAFWMPTSQAMTVNLVPAEVFPSAISINQTLFETAVITGPAIGGLLYAFGDTTGLMPGALLVYGVALVLLLVVVYLMGSIRPMKPPENAAPVTLHGLFEGLRFVFRRRPVLGAISLDLFAVLFGGATALLPVYAADILHVGPVGLGVLRTAPGVGAALTAVALAMHPIARHAGRWMFGGVGLYAVATIVFGLSSSFVLSGLALVAIGAGDMVSVYVRHLLVQLETPDAIRGRVSAVSSMFIGASNELGEFESGVTAGWFGTVPAVVAGGAACGIVVLGYLWWFPELRRLDRFPQQTAR